MKSLLKVIGIFLYFNLVEVQPYNYDANPYGYVAAVNNINTFPKKGLFGYKKYYRSNSYMSDKANEHAVDSQSQSKVLSSNTHFALPKKDNYFSSTLKPMVLKRQNNALAETVNKYKGKRKELFHDKMKNNTQSFDMTKFQETYFNTNQNSPAVDQRSNTNKNLPNRKNNNISQIKKNFDSNQNHDGVENTLHNTQLLEYKKMFPKVNSNERYQQTWPRIDNLQKYIDTLARQAEYRQTEAMKHTSDGKKHQQQQQKIYDSEHYEPSNWISMKNVRNEKILNLPARVVSSDVGKVKKTPYSLFYNMNRENYEQTPLLGQDIEASINVDDVITFAKLHKRHAEIDNNVGNIIMNYNSLLDR